METVKNQSKNQLREKMLAKLATLIQNETIRRSKDVEVNLSNLCDYKNSETILFYYPLGGEVDLRRIIRKAFLTKKVCLPVVNLTKKELKIYQINNLEDNLAKGAFGIKEPHKEKAKEVGPEAIDAVIVPGLAFDFQKNRLGRGGGFYDRFLSKVPSFTKKIGVAFDFQILEDLPVNLSQDQQVDLIVTESRVI